MDRGHNARGQVRFQNFPALAGDAEGRAKDRLRRGRAQADENFRPNEAQFRLKPGPAGRDIARARFLVDAPFSARLPLEMLDRVGDVNGVAIDFRVDERSIEQLAGRTNERLPVQIFLITRLLAEEHECGLLRAFAEDGLGRMFGERARGAAESSFPHFR